MMLYYIYITFFFTNTKFFKPFDNMKVNKLQIIREKIV